jgi:hypothetical protein
VRDPSVSTGHHKQQIRVIKTHTSGYCVDCFGINSVVMCDTTGPRHVASYSSRRGLNWGLDSTVDVGDRDGIDLCRDAFAGSSAVGSFELSKVGTDYRCIERKVNQ